MKCDKKRGSTLMPTKGGKEQQPNLKKLYGFWRFFFSEDKKCISFLNTQYMNGTADGNLMTIYSPQLQI